jgi:hypothetical protein
MSNSLGEEDTAASAVDHGGDVSHVEPDDIGVGMLTVLFGFVAVVVLLVVVLLQVWFYNWKVELSAQRAGPIDTQLAPAMIAEKQRQRIETYGWADPKTRARAIPIERAMELVAADMVAEYAAPAESAKKTGEK